MNWWKGQLTGMRDETECLLKQSAEMGAPQVSYSTDELSDSQQAYIYAQVLPYLAGLAEKMPLDEFQSHEVEGTIPFSGMTVFLWPGGRLLAAAVNARFCNGA